MHGMQKIDIMRAIEHLRLRESQEDFEFTEWKTALERELPEFWSSMKK